MARDPQAALVALNRFGFGARGGASGDLINVASDPRGFVTAELNRPNVVALELPGLQSTPALAQAVFAYQAEVKLAREAAAKSGNPPSETAAAEMSGKISGTQPPEKAGATAPMQAADAMATQPSAAKPQAQQAAKPLNLPLRDPVDLRDLFRADRPVDRLDVLLDLLDAGGAGDDA